MALATRTCPYCHTKWVIRVETPKRCPHCKRVLKPRRIGKRP
jgi:hypothetical protein